MRKRVQKSKKIIPNYLQLTYNAFQLILTNADIFVPIHCLHSSYILFLSSIPTSMFYPCMHHLSLTLFSSLCYLCINRHDLSMYSLVNLISYIVSMFTMALIRLFVSFLVVCFQLPSSCCAVGLRNCCGKLAKLFVRSRILSYLIYIIFVSPSLLSLSIFPFLHFQLPISTVQFHHLFSPPFHGLTPVLVCLMFSKASCSPH